MPVPKIIVPFEKEAKGNENITPPKLKMPLTKEVKTINLVPPSPVASESPPLSVAPVPATTSKAEKTHIGPWELGKTVGKGGSSSVRLVRHCKTKELAVAKIVAKGMAEKVRARSLANLALRIEDGRPTMAADWRMPVALEREVAIMRLLNHTNIVRLFDVWENHEEM
jgi:hypothetical protein